MKSLLSSPWFPCVVAATMASGCAGPWAAVNGSAVDKATHAHVSAESSKNAEEKLITESLELASETPAITHEAALAGVLDELQEIGAIDPSAQQQLMDDLKQTKPEHYTLVVDQFRAALAYRQQMAARDQANQSLAKTDAQGREEPAQIAVAENSPRRAVASHKLAATRQPQRPQTPQPYQMHDRAAAVASDVRDASSDFADSRPLPPPPLKPSAASDLLENQVSKDDEPRRDDQLQTASHAAPHPPVNMPSTDQSGAAATWSSQLDAAIAQLKQKVSPNPHTVEEVHLHMRLRALELLAGREEEALRPIPGATPAQQDYWAKQLYAISTFLDEKTYVDAKARAAAALVHLDAARSQLAELATLHVRNLAFVDSVDGFGEYKTTESTEFQPGAQATLYTEVENYRSESTKRGYRTLLTTSYQILDKAGQRVDGGQFPDVEDYCQNRRRDFHMQYTIPLPTRIYAGQYEMQLIITDGLSNKIGQASVPFEIAE